MGINHITLSPQLVAALYPDSLVIPGAGHSAAGPAGPRPFLGENRRKIVFVVYCPGTAFCPDDQLEFLEKILRACQCGLADIALVNAAELPVDLEGLKKQLDPRILFVCGVPPAAFPLSGGPEPFTVQSRAGLSLLLLPSLEDLILDADSGLKKKLWACLKKIFQI